MYTGINLFDVLIVLVCCKILMGGYKGRFYNEIFLLFSAFIATIFAVHYYERFGIFLGRNLHMLGEEFFFAFIFISGLILAIYPATRDGWRILINTSIEMDVNPWILTLIAGFRAFFISIMIFICLVLTNNEFLVSMVRSSFSQLLLRGASESIYKSFYNGIIQTDSLSEPLNHHLFKILNQVNTSSEDQSSKSEEL